MLSENVFIDQGVQDCNKWNKTHDFCFLSLKFFFIYIEYFLRTDATDEMWCDIENKPGALALAIRPRRSQLPIRH